LFVQLKKEKISFGVVLTGGVVLTLFFLPRLFMNNFFIMKQKGNFRVKDHVVIMKEDGKHFAFPGVTKAKNGDILVVAREGVAHVDPYGKVVLSRSTDNGKTWSERVTVYDIPLDERDTSIECLSDGTILLSFVSRNIFYNPLKQYKEVVESWKKEGKLTKEHLKRAGAFVLRSKDNGYTWEGPFRTPVFSPSGVVEGTDGYIYYGGAGRIKIARSKDKGETWEDYPANFISQEGELEDLREPSLLISGNRWIIMYCLVSSAREFLRISTSDDAGHTWTWPKKTVMWGKPAHLLELRDGRILCVYGYRRKPYGIRATISYDRGKTWDIDNEIIVWTRKDRKLCDLGYPESILLDDGRVFTVYYHNFIGGRLNCFISGSSYRVPSKK